MRQCGKYQTRITESSCCRYTLSCMTLSEFLRQRANDVQGEVTLGWLTSQAGISLPGLVLALTAIPSVLPIPGVGNLTGAALIYLAARLWQGRPLTSLPPRMLAYRIGPAHAARLLRLLAWLHEAASRRLRRRVTALVGPSSWTWCCMPVAAVGVVIFLPIPLGNLLGAFSLVALGLGHAMEDGCAIAVGWLVSVLTVAYSLVLGWGLGVFAFSGWDRMVVVSGP